ncbi:MAG: UDP-N-acetylglucosamine pyrophosphorylase [Syntrophobacterales bacterium]|nr:UDP-N-acetylglucosamine pyrophosphorylase [Syntrophobacterales bacterium]
MDMKIPETVIRLREKGVTMPNPGLVEIGAEVDPERIAANGVVLFGGTRITGKKTLLSAGVKLGEEAPVVLDNCSLGENVELKGGFFSDSVFLERVSMASGAHIRAGCLLEEEAKTGHTVGLKQTILFPFVTLGSLINFCDVLMAGGTSRKNHSEVGSSYIHFNYTPNQDKATASLLGDVPRGVMLKEAPIFLGGQGGLIGPARIGFGTVIAAGEVWSGDCPEGGKLLRSGRKPAIEKGFHPGLYGDIKRRVINNIIYYANLLALRQWYIHIRARFFRDAEYGDALIEGALEVIDAAASERLSRFRALAENMDSSIALGQKLLPEHVREKILRRQGEFRDRWGELEKGIAGQREADAGKSMREQFLTSFFASPNGAGKDYLGVMAALDKEVSSTGAKWMQCTVDDVVERALSIIPSFR